MVDFVHGLVIHERLQLLSGYWKELAGVNSYIRNLRGERIAQVSVAVTMQHPSAEMALVPSDHRVVAKDDTLTVNSQFMVEVNLAKLLPHFRPTHLFVMVAEDEELLPRKSVKDQADSFLVTEGKVAQMKDHVSGLHD